MANTPPTAQEFADKVLAATLGTMETFNLYLGERLWQPHGRR